ncbi:hypothetical protein C772_02457 [Bhargavaea cecembensis DSE10]|uniref:Spore coat protein n=1 Tax=Bhargavaea cecembensis DSE10 TaxID=1235279 RepID=M7NVE3_9BACL|nr:hypothetical protein [Bhargavaea cecembensis]EMR05635.1 hypothetical protein C772_02457 [Bhargavaea cecembensis DSE10]
MTDKETGKEEDQQQDQATEKKKNQESEASKNQQGQNDGSLNDKEMAILLLRMEEQLCQLYLQADNETYSSKLESLLSSFLQNANSNRRNLCDLITRHGWMTPEAAKREDFEKVIQKFEGSAPPVV